MRLFDDIAERRIQAAQEAGEFDRLPGMGRALIITEDFSMPIEVRLAQRRLQQLVTGDRFTLAAQLRERLIARRRALQPANPTPDRPGTHTGQSPGGLT